MSDRQPDGPAGSRRPVRRVRRPLRPRIADAGLPRAGEVVRRCLGRPGVPRRARRAAAPLRRPTHTGDRVRSAVGAAGGAGAAQAGGPGPHRLAQAEQRRGPGPPHQADGQDAHDRRDRERASTAWPPPRLPPCSAWSARSSWARSTRSARSSTSSGWSCWAPRSAPVTSGSRTLEGRRERGHARVGGDGGDHALLPRVGHGSAPVPLHGAPAPAGRRGRGARAVPRPARRCRSRRRRRLHRRAAPTRRGRSPASWTRRPGWSAWKRPAGRPSPTAFRASCTACTRACSRTRWGRFEEAESISAGLDYPGLGPEHAHLAAVGRAEYSTAGDDEVLEAFRLLSHTEGIIPALESAHAVAWVARSAGTDALPAGSTVLITLSGRGDKDVAQVREIFGRASRCLTSRRSSGPAASVAASC